MPRTDVIKPYLFASIDEKLNKLKNEGIEIISFGVGDPDSPPPMELRQKLSSMILSDSMHNYSPYEGTNEFRKSANAYMKRRYGADFDTDSEIVGLIGSKEGIGNYFFAMTMPDSINLVPSLCYPIPGTITALGGGRTHVMPTLPEKGFLPDLSMISPEVAEKATLLYLNYPNNPTGVTAPLEYYKKALDFAEENDLIIVHDNAYEEIYFNERPHSFFELSGAKKRVIEFHSLSKMFNITGWRLAFAVGNPALLKPLKTMKTNMDSGQFKPLQFAGAWALDNLIDDFGAKQRNTYRKRMERILAALRKTGAKVEIPGGTFFLWGKVPEGMTSHEYTDFMLDKYRIFITPGVMFGPEGEGYFRASMTVSEKLLEDALTRLEK